MCLFACVSLCKGYCNQSTTEIVIPGVRMYSEIEFTDLIQGRSFRNDANSIHLNLDQYGVFEIELERTHIVDLTEVQRSLPDEHIFEFFTYRGWVVNGGNARLTVAENFIYGYIESSEEIFWIEPARYYSKSSSSSSVVIYRGSDVVFDPNLICGNTETTKRVKDIQQSLRGERSGSCYTVEMAIASDFSMYEKFNNSTADVLLHNVGVMNNVNGIYTNVFDDDLEFVIVEQYVSTCATCDPWSSSTNASTLLSSFTSWGAGGGFNEDFDLGQLWTNRNLDGPTIGLAWLNGACGSNKYHILQDFSSNANLLRVLAGHEIAHNFGASHDSGVLTHVMAPYVQNTTTWSANSISEISDAIDDLVAGGSCLTNCPGTNLIAMFGADDTIQCGTGFVQFTDNSINNPTSWSWTFNGANPSSSSVQNPIVQYEVPGTYDVSLIVANGTSTDTITRVNYITMASLPNASFDFVATDNTVAFFESTIVGACLWNFGDGNSSTSSNPVHTYTSDGAYDVSLVSTNICGSETQQLQLSIDDCLQSMELNNMIESGSYVASSHVEFNGTIGTNKVVYGHAPNHSTLNPGFTIEQGGILIITNSGCTH